MDGAEPDLTSATLETPGSLLSAPLRERSQMEGIRGFAGLQSSEDISEGHRKPPRARGCKKPEGGGGGGGEKSSI